MSACRGTCSRSSTAPAGRPTRRCASSPNRCACCSRSIGISLPIPIRSHATARPVASHLRQVLLAELDNVHFGKTFQCYEDHDGHITAYFEDGTSAEGNVLVAADGGGSRVQI